MFRRAPMLAEHFVLEEAPGGLFEIQTGTLPAATQPHKDATERQQANASTCLWRSVRACDRRI